MDKSIESLEHDEDVVIIEERDKHTMSYIIAAAVVGIAVGGLLSIFVTDSAWKQGYRQLERQLQQSEQARQTQQAIIVEKEVAVAYNPEELEQQVTERVVEKMALVAKQNQEEVDQLQLTITELEQTNSKLEEQLEIKNGQLSKQTKSIQKLQSQLGVQAGVFDRSRELFQRELIIKQELSGLQQQRTKLEPQLKRYQRECEAYQQGASFELNSSACDNLDETNSAISQIDQEIELHKLDLKEIEYLAAEMGL